MYAIDVQTHLCNQQVGGSSPSTGSITYGKQSSEYGGIPELSLIHIFRFCVGASGKPEGKGIESVIDRSLLRLFLFLVSLVINCVGFSNVGFSNIGFSNVRLSNVGKACAGSSGVGSVRGCA